MASNKVEAVFSVEDRRWAAQLTKSLEDLKRVAWSHLLQGDERKEYQTMQTNNPLTAYPEAPEQVEVAGSEVPLTPATHFYYDEERDAYGISSTQPVLAGVLLDVSQFLAGIKGRNAAERTAPWLEQLGALAWRYDKKGAGYWQPDNTPKLHRMTYGEPPRAEAVSVGATDPRNLVASVDHYAGDPGYL